MTNTDERPHADPTPQPDFGIHNGPPAQRNDPSMKPEASPDILAGGNLPPPVSRAGKRPLMIAGCFGLAVFGVLVYSLSTRGAENAKDDANTGGMIQQPKTGGGVEVGPEVLKDAPESGIVGAEPWDAAGGPPHLFEAGAMDPNGPPPPQLVQQNAATGAATNPHAAAWEAYYQQRQAVTQARYELARNAVGSGSGVDVSSRQAPGQAQQGGSQGPMADLTRALAAQGVNPATLQGGPSAGAVGAGRGGGGSQDLNRQEDKRAFLETSGGRNPYAAGRVESALSANEVKAGTVIPITLITGVNSDLPGQVVAQVRQNVFDSATGRRLLIPQGARIVGTYDSAVTTGQTRVLLAWNRIIYPDGSSIDIGSMPGADRAGYSGMRDRVNNHHARTFGNAIFLSLFSAGIQLSQPQASQGEQVTSQQTVAAQLGQQLGQLGMETARRNMQIQPSLTIRPGAVGNVALTQDLILREWIRR